MFKISFEIEYLIDDFFLNRSNFVNCLEIETNAVHLRAMLYYICTFLSWIEFGTSICAEISTSLHLSLRMVYIADGSDKWQRVSCSNAKINTNTEKSTDLKK